ncbi:MAG: HEAT repeat domain-containing protein [Cyanobacteria bacterium HKST-UBA06]|nr:HEAT repeat domain-containing protein [Cyanobacteria bacterium HKST-UBA05]MCA9799008.1 HEAT repeat domain-containing protein [Cyanobacteria bacterium HKST-UBA04]MCA9807888.1 HEAT repeat domain-containing protein [Cyanobacteria bacterium HKST-UBA06]
MTQEAIQLLTNPDKDTLVRLNALYEIVQEFEPTHFSLLEGILQDTDEHPDVRSAVALALGKVGGQQAFNILKGFEHEADITVKNHVIQGLGMTGETDALPILVNALWDSNNHVFASATNGLSLFGQRATSVLIELLDADKEDIRCVAAWRLGELEVREAVNPLLATLAEEKDPEVIALCVWALGEIGVYSDEVMTQLNAWRDNQNPDIYKRANDAIHKIARHIN